MARDEVSDTEKPARDGSYLCADGLHRCRLALAVEHVKGSSANGIDLL